MFDRVGVCFQLFASLVIYYMFDLLSCLLNLFISLFVFQLLASGALNVHLSTLT